jgi:hypothetical protein
MSSNKRSTRRFPSHALWLCPASALPTFPPAQRLIQNILSQNSGGEPVWKGLLTVPPASFRMLIYALYHHYNKSHLLRSAVPATCPLSKYVTRYSSQEWRPRKTSLLRNNIILPVPPPAVCHSGHIFCFRYSGKFRARLGILLILCFPLVDFSYCFAPSFPGFSFSFLTNSKL